uniref:Putative serine protease n=1 Tax=Panstrongylus lignarius TaxID=156445 RepID=A0A224XGL1_9HEMI
MKKFYLTGLLMSLLGLGSLHPFHEGDNDGSGPDSSEYGVIQTDVDNNCTCGRANKEDQRIVGGRTTKVNEYPMIAGFVLLKEDLIVCGGTIITRRHVVTAAHCTDGFKTSEFRIFIGHHNYQQVKATAKLLELQQFFVHEKYNAFSLKYDISVVLTKQSMEFGENVGPACLPKVRIPLVGERVKALGWGLTRYYGKPSEVLLQVNVDVQPFEQCNLHNPHLEMQDIHQLCTYRKNKDSCSGDSGGPLLWRDPDTNMYTLVATTSYGTNCAKYPAVNCDIVYFLPWIQNIISRSDPSLQTCAKI